MAAFEVIALDTATPQLRAPGASDTYTFPRAVEMPLGTANGVLYLDGSKVVTSGSALTFDGTNLGLGVTPSAWFGGYKAIDIGTNGAVFAFSTNSGMAFNAFDDAAWKYKSSAFAGRSFFSTSNGSFVWLTAPSGTAGNPISFTQAMTLNASGNLGIGATSPSNQLHIKAATNPVIRMESASDSGYIDYNSTRLQFSSGGGSLYFVAGNTERVRIKSTGQVRFVPLAADPSGAEAGDVYYNSGTNKLRLYDGSTWVDLN